MQQGEEWGSGSCVLNLPGQLPKHLFQKQAREGDIWGEGGGGGGWKEEFRRRGKNGTHSRNGLLMSQLSAGDTSQSQSWTCQMGQISPNETPRA